MRGSRDAEMAYDCTQARLQTQTEMYIRIPHSYPQYSGLYVKLLAESHVSQYAFSPNSECLRGSNDVSLPGSTQHLWAVPVSTFMVPEYFLCAAAVLGDGLTHFAPVVRTFCNTHVKKHTNLHSFRPSTNLVPV